MYFQRKLDPYRVPLIAGALTLLISTLTLIGWHFDISILKSVFPGFVTMKVNAALGLIAFGGVSVLSDRLFLRKSWAKKGARLLIFFGALVGILTLIEYVFHISLGIDEFFYRDLADYGQSYPSGRLAPITAMSFVFFGVGLFYGGLGTKFKARISQSLLFIVALASLQALIDYMIGRQTSFGNGSHTRIAINTAVCFILLSTSFISLSSHRGYMRIFLKRTNAGHLARNLVLALLVMPPVFKLLVMLGEHVDLFDADFSALFRSVISITFFVTLVLRSAEQLHHSERVHKLTSTVLQKQEKEREKLRLSRALAQAVQASEARLRMILSSTFDGIIGFNTEAIITEWNLQSEKIFGWSHHEVIGKSMIRLLCLPDEQQNRWTHFQAICNAYDFSHFEKPIEVQTLTKSGQKISVRMGISFTHISGELLFIASVQDISEEKKSELELVQSREEALNATRSKSQFLANMSHEIRTPMNGVIGMATVLLDSALSESQRESAKLIKQSAESLLSIVNGILDHSKIEAGKLELDNRTFSFAEVARDVTQILRLAADEKGISLRLSLEIDESLTVIGDSGRVRQILINLISNAIKFTEVGDVLLKVTGRKTDAEHLQLHFEVIDSGPGLSPEEISKLFQLYGQTESGMKKGGTGLGLYISSELIRLMNGQYGVKSQIGKGSNFWFEINFKHGDKIPMPSREGTTDLLSGHVLVAEDQLVNQRVVGSYLAKLGVRFDMAPNGAIALQMLENSVYDLILMDCRMPIIDGYETTKMIRAKEKIVGGRIPIVALSAEISADDRRRCFDLGMDEFLGKPIDISKLTWCLAKWLTKEPDRSFVIDQSAMKKLAGFTSGAQDLVSILIGEFSRTARASVDNIHFAFQIGDMKHISDLAHGLKSTSATLGLIRVAEMCQIIESLPEIPPNMVSLISRLEVEVLLAETDLTRLRSTPTYE